VRFEFAKIKTTKIILHLKSPTFSAAKLRVLQYLSTLHIELRHKTESDVSLDKLDINIERLVHNDILNYHHWHTQNFILDGYKLN